MSFLSKIGFGFARSAKSLITRSLITDLCPTNNSLVSKSFATSAKVFSNKAKDENPVMIVRERTYRSNWSHFPPLLFMSTLGLGASISNDDDQEKLRNAKYLVAKALQHSSNDEYLEMLKCINELSDMDEKTSKELMNFYDVDEEIVNILIDTLLKKTAPKKSVKTD